MNVFGLARLIQLVVPHMRGRGSGRIINVSSIGGKIYEPLGAWYHATKFAVEGLSDSLRLELRPFGVDVVLIEPGPTLSEWNAIARETWPRRPRGALTPTGLSRCPRCSRPSTPRGRSSQPVVVARKIVEAATVRRPRARYPVGRSAGTIMRLRKVLPDTAMDAVITRMFP